MTCHHPTMRVALVIAVLLLVAPAAAQTVQTRVWVAQEQPLRVRGNGFAAADRVTVTVRRGNAVFRKMVVATRTGTFRAAWLRGLPIVCANTTVVAVGSSGRRATARTVVDDCGPPIR